MTNLRPEERLLRSSVGIVQAIGVGKIFRVGVFVDVCLTATGMCTENIPRRSLKLCNNTLAGAFFFVSTTSAPFFGNIVPSPPPSLLLTPSLPPARPPLPTPSPRPPLRMCFHGVSRLISAGFVKWRTGKHVAVTSFDDSCEYVIRGIGGRLLLDAEVKTCAFNLFSFQMRFLTSFKSCVVLYLFAINTKKSAIF